MTKNKGIDDFAVIFSDQAKSAMEDPECAEAVRDMMAQLRQALCDIDPKDTASVDAAMKKFGGIRVDPEDFPEDDDGE